MVLGKIVNLWLEWSNTLLEDMPVRLVTPLGLKPNKPLTVNIKDVNDFLDNPILLIEEQLQTSIHKIKGRVVDVYLAPENALDRTIKLPKMRANDVLKVLRTNLQKASPIQLKDLTWRQGLVFKSGDKNIHHQLVIKNERLKIIEKTLEAIGLVTRKISVATANKEFIDYSEYHNRFNRAWLMLNILLITVSISFWVVTQYSHLKELRIANSHLHAEIDDLRTHAINQVEKATIEARNAETAQLSTAELNYDRKRTMLLKNLTDFFSDNTWISEVVIKGQKVSLGGFSTQGIPDILSSLRQENWVKSAQLKSSISGARTSKSKRFQIEIMVQ